MLLIPVIEIKNGKPSRMIEGFDCNSVFHSCDILTLAKLFRKENAKCIHITDLDCATSGELVNYHMLKKVIDSVGIPVQLGGGIRNLSIAKKLLEELGIYRLVLGTAVSENLSLLENLLSEYGPSKLVVSIDVKDGYCMKTGWKEKSKISSVQFAKELKKLGFFEGGDFFRTEH
jgi:phosphoribosylformimino-5-aminoimidazole carboxamide ribotide isomerase